MDGLGDPGSPPMKVERIRLSAALLLSAAACAAVGSGGDAAQDGWSRAELDAIRGLCIDAREPLPPDPSNRYADDPAAVRLGRELYHELNLSANRQVTCATCHRGEYQFTDELKLSQGIGETARRSMPLRGVAWQRWFFWDGRKDSLWSQALAPLEHPDEHGISRTRVAQVVARQYEAMYVNAFGPLPEIEFRRLPRNARPAPDDPNADAAWRDLSPAERELTTAVFVHAGKAIAAFVRSIPPRTANFDRYARALDGGDPAGLARINAEQKRGLRLFLGKAGCVECHSGPFLTDGGFHAVGVPDDGAPDRGRAEGLALLAADEFGWSSRWSDADPVVDPAPIPSVGGDTERAFKTPGLRDVSRRPPYMHAGQYATLAELLQHSRVPSSHGSSDTPGPDRLSDAELAQLEAFLLAL